METLVRNEKREGTIVGGLARGSISDLRRRIDAAAGRRKVDLLIKGGRLVDVFSGCLRNADIAITGDRIVGFGEYPARREIDAFGRFVTPGFMDGHVHLESSMVVPAQYARAAVSHGTAAVVIDPHEIANVMGLRGIQWMVRAAAGNPLGVFVMVPSCVPATSMETAGASLSEADMEALVDEPWALGIGEVMNFPGVIAAVPAVLRKLTLSGGKRIDGHAPQLSGRGLYAYVAAGITSDHECTTLDEAREKLAAGMVIMIREGSSARNLAELAPLVTQANARRFMLVSDDRHPHDLAHEGHMDATLRKAIRLGLDPITAIRMATLNPAEYFGLHDMGGIAPGYRADVVILKDLKDFHVEWVIHGGKPVVEDGVLQETAFRLKIPRLAHSVHVPRVQPKDLQIAAKSGRARVIEVIPGQIVTDVSLQSVPVIKGYCHTDPGRDVLKIVVVERHHGSGRIGKGFVRGFGLTAGAIGSSVSHDSHNLIVVGTNDADMALAINEISKIQGGLVATAHGRVRGALPLPIAGLLSDRPVEEVARALAHLEELAREMGSRVTRPFMALSFLALPVIPRLKITDKGLVDVNAFQLVDLFV